MKPNPLLAMGTLMELLWLLGPFLVARALRTDTDEKRRPAFELISVL